MTAPWRVALVVSVVGCLLCSLTALIRANEERRRVDMSLLIVAERMERIDAQRAVLDREAKALRHANEDFYRWQREAMQEINDARGVAAAQTNYILALDGAVREIIDILQRRGETR